MNETVVSYSGVFFTNQCVNCSEKKFELVQTQDYLIALGPFRAFGKGPRNLKAVCIKCNNIISLTEKQKQKAMKLKYGPKSRESETLLSRDESTRKFPPLDADRRSAIRKDNRKEGLLSMLIGVIIGILIAPLPFFEPWITYIGLGIIAYSILGGLYAIFEDPERKYRNIMLKKSKLRL